MDESFSANNDDNFENSSRHSTSFFNHSLSGTSRGATHTQNTMLLANRVADLSHGNNDLSDDKEFELTSLYTRVRHLVSRRCSASSSHRLLQHREEVHNIDEDCEDNIFSILL